MIEWEYSVVKRSGRQANEIIKELDRLGSEGWELVFSEPPHFYFKRKIDKPRGRPKKK